MPEEVFRRHRGKSAPRGRSPNAKALKKASKQGEAYVTPPPRVKKASPRCKSVEKDHVRQRISFGENRVHDIVPENKAPDLREAESILLALKDPLCVLLLSLPIYIAQSSVCFVSRLQPHASRTSLAKRGPVRVLQVQRRNQTCSLSIGRSMNVQGSIQKRQGFLGS